MQSCNSKQMDDIALAASGPFCVKLEWNGEVYPIIYYTDMNSEEQYALAKASLEEHYDNRNRAGRVGY